VSKLTWDQIGNRLYETGVDRGVLYIPNNLGAYVNGYAWNGLTGVTEKPTGAAVTPKYADNLKYLNLISVEQFGGSIDAFTYPTEFGQCDGTASPQAGISLGQQPRKTFGLCYRTRVGNDIDGTDHGYKLHLIYGALAGPSDKAYTTINDTPEAMAFSWTITTTPIDVPGYKPTASITIDSTLVDATALATLEGFLYGTTGTNPSLPQPADVLAMFSGSVTVAVPVAPTFDSGTKVITIPAVTGIAYQINGVTKAAGALPAITTDTLVVAVPLTGYKFPAVTDSDWFFSFT
jgi:hypothetical protein